MATEKRYLHDRLVLLLLSTSAFLAFLGSALILLRLNNSHSNGYIIEYRSNLGISGFTDGHLIDVLSFIVFLFLVLGLHTVLSHRIYHSYRPFSLCILGLGILLLILTIIVSNALLALR